jgi:perosamine synthetase
MNHPITLLCEAPATTAERIPVYQPDLSGNESEYVMQCMREGWISSRGSFIERFERAFARRVGTLNAISVCNGSVAIQVALAALGIGPGDEVIVPSLTYIASVNAIVAVGATPVFADSDAATWQLAPQEIERLRTPRTRAVMPVHLYGHACDMVAITTWAARHGILVIEDCAESFGTTVNGWHTGTFGDAATFSFFGNKTMTTGEGGMVVFRNRRHRNAGYAYKTQGVSQTRTYWHESLGFNFRMTNIQAAIGLAQLERADAIIARKRQLAAMYEHALAGVRLRFARLAPGVSSSYWMVSCVLDEPCWRDGLMAHLERHGVETRPFFHPAHVLPMYQDDRVRLPVAERLSAAGLNLPSWPGLRPHQVERICRLIRDHLTSVGSRPS